jgi:hypothetical protein
MGILYFCTGGLCIIGKLVDACSMDNLVARANAYLPVTIVNNNGGGNSGVSEAQIRQIFEEEQKKAKLEAEVEMLKQQLVQKSPGVYTYATAPPVTYSNSDYFQQQPPPQGMHMG